MNVKLSEYENLRRKARLRTAKGLANQKAYRIFRGLIALFSSFFMKPIIYNNELIPQPGGVNYLPAEAKLIGSSSDVVVEPFIIAANHGSVFDIPFIGQFKRSLVWVCKPHFCLNPIAARINQRMGAVPVFRPSVDGDTTKNSHKRIKALKMASYEPSELINVVVEAVDHGTPVIIFPEGSRVGDDLVAEAKFGTAKIAMKSNCPILPIAIVGSSKTDPVVRKGLLRRRVVIGLVGELIHPKDYAHIDDSRDAEKAIMEAWIDSINNLRKQGLDLLPTI